jgi:hypothetical protein
MVATCTRTIEPGIVERIVDGVRLIYIESRDVNQFQNLVKLLVEEFEANIVRPVYRAEDGHPEFADLSGFNLVEANANGDR